MTKYTEKDLSPFFPADVRPVHAGWYHVRCVNIEYRFKDTIFPDRKPEMRYWNGVWRFGPKKRISNFGKVRHCKDEWRGLRFEPREASK